MVTAKRVLQDFNESSIYRKVKIGNDQEMVQSDTRFVLEKKKYQQSVSYTCTKKTYRKTSEQLFPNRRPFIYPNLTKK